jgi:alpha-glucoside transport system permease protein
MPARNSAARTLGALAGFVAALVVLWWGLSFLRQSDGPERMIVRIYRLAGAESAASLVEQYGLTPNTSKLISAAVAIAVGVGGVWLLFITVNLLVDRLGQRFESIVRPWIFVLPALALLGFYLVYPAVRTVILSFTDRAEGTGLLDNYRFAFTDPDMLTAMRNNVLWLVVGTTGAVVIGLLFATLVDRLRREALAKTFIFLPLAISMVGAAVIWRFVYYWRPPGETQIGLLNGILEFFGKEPFSFFQTAPINTFALIVIMVWLQTGFAMVILSAAVKGVPDELLEAARIDGASEPQVFAKVIVPSIRGSIITVSTAVFIAILKVFDIVFVTTGGKFETDVIANRMFRELIRFRNPGRASALAVILLVVVTPIMVINIRNLRRQGVGA